MTKKNHGEGASLLAAALALPGLAATLASGIAQAEEPPEHASLDLKYLYYRDYQAGERRMRVDAPSFYLVAPLAERYSVSGSFVMDTMTGASPLFHDTLSGASGIGVHDRRKAGDIKLTRYFERAAVAAQFAYSTETDYVSRAYSVEGRVSTPDNNTTIALGAGFTYDDINSENLVARGEHKRTADVMLGVTQVLSANDIIQSNVTYARGRGYYDDPYKAIDVRPDFRNQFAWLTRWNHHFSGLDATLRMSARWYRDTFGVRAITLGSEWVQPIGAWTLTPGVRYTTQGAADFYYGPPFPQGFRLNEPYSADQRLSAFGAITAGIKVARSFAGGWRADFKIEHYEQRSDWRRFVSGDDTRPLKTFKAQFYQFGLGKDF